MSEDSIVKIGGKSQEEVALHLLKQFEADKGDLLGDERLNKYRDILAMVRNPFQPETRF